MQATRPFPLLDNTRVTPRALLQEERSQRLARRSSPLCENREPSPRRRRRGPITATRSPPGCRRRARVSTAETPWPHYSRGEYDALQRFIPSPRRRRRGPIAALPTTASAPRTTRIPTAGTSWPHYSVTRNSRSSSHLVIHPHDGNVVAPLQPEDVDVFAVAERHSPRRERRGPITGGRATPRRHHRARLHGGDAVAHCSLALSTRSSQTTRIPTAGTPWGHCSHKGRVRGAAVLSSPRRERRGPIAA
jgi:hypothetical protein